MADITTLRQCRIELCDYDKFAAKCVQNPILTSWFPTNIKRRNIKNAQEYREEFARCERLKNSPRFYMRRRMNREPEKNYGAIYRHFCDKP